MVRLMRPLAFALVCGLLALVQAPESQAGKGGGGKGGGGKMMKGKHPHIQHAIHALEKAKHELEAAGHDFGGHKVASLAAIQTAIAQLGKAIEHADGASSGNGNGKMMKKKKMMKTK